MRVLLAWGLWPNESLAVPGQSSRDRGALHESARVRWGPLSAINYLSFKQDLTSATQCPQPVRQGALGEGGWLPLGSRPGAGQAGIVKCQVMAHPSSKIPHGSLLPHTLLLPGFQHFCNFALFWGRGY